MILKYYKDCYDLSKVYKFSINNRADGINVVDIYFPNIFQDGKQEVIRLLSNKNEALYKRVVDFLQKSEIIEYKEDLSQFFE